MDEPNSKALADAEDEPPIQVEGGRDDGQSETTPEVVIDRSAQSTIDYEGWDEEAAREQDNLPEDDQQG